MSIPKQNKTTISHIVMFYTFELSCPHVPKKKKNSTWDRKKLASFPAGILVNGQLVGAKKPKNKKLSTYFGKLGFYFQHEDVKVEVSTETISLTGGSRTSVLSWSDTAHVLNQRQVLLYPDSVTSTHDPINHPRRP